MNSPPASPVKLAFLSCLLIIALAACATRRPMWAVTMTPTPEAVQAAMAQDPYYPYRGEFNTRHLPQFEQPLRLRPCCVFGMDVKVSVKAIPVPIYQIVNIVDRDQLGPHTYDAGFFGGYGTDRDTGTKENNGIVYTCRGGFIDTAHVRDYADLTVFLFFEFLRNLGTSFDVELQGELGPRVIQVDPLEIKGDKFERARVATVLASWTAFQLATWHEIAQWHGYREFSMFSEEPSAYSVEDAYSNLLGITIANGLIYSALLFNDNQYARNFDTWCQAALETLGAVSIEESRRSMRSVDGLWWDSTKRLPDKFFVLKRNYATGPVQRPSLVPTDRFKGEPCPCSAAPSPKVLELKDRLYGRPISERVHITLFVNEAARQTFAPGTAFATHPHAIVPAEFAAIAKADQQADARSLASLRREPPGSATAGATP